MYEQIWQNCKTRILQVVLILFTNPSARAGYDTMSFFKWILTGLNSEYSFSLTSCLTKAEELSLPYYLPIAGGRIIGFIPFVRVLVLCEMQSVSSRFWTRVAVSISYDDNHYTTGTWWSWYARGHQPKYFYVIASFVRCSLSKKLPPPFNRFCFSSCWVSSYPLHQTTWWGYLFRKFRVPLNCLLS